MRFVAFVAAAACALACSYKPAGETDAPATAQVAQSVRAVATAEIRLERTACFHSCPEYSVSVSPDGSVRYNGLRNVAHTGVRTATVPADSAAALFKFADSVGFESLAGQYIHGTRGCDPYIADLPGLIVTLVRSGGGTRVEGDAGCPSIPSALVNFATMIDHVAGAERWTVKK